MEYIPPEILLQILDWFPNPLSVARVGKLWLLLSRYAYRKRDEYFLESLPNIQNAIYSSLSQNNDAVFIHQDFSTTKIEDVADEFPEIKDAYGAVILSQLIISVTFLIPIIENLQFLYIDNVDFEEFPEMYSILEKSESLRYLHIKADGRVLDSKKFISSLDCHSLRVLTLEGFDVDNLFELLNGFQKLHIVDLRLIDINSLSSNPLQIRLPDSLTRLTVNNVQLIWHLLSIGQSQMLTHLSIRQKRFDPSHLKELIMNVQQCKTLQYLSLNCPIHEFEILVELLKHPNLKNIKLHRFTNIKSMIPYLSEIFDSGISHFDIDYYELLFGGQRIPEFDFDADNETFILICQEFYMFYKKEDAIRNQFLDLAKKFVGERSFGEQLNMIMDLFISKEFPDRPQYHDRARQIFLTDE